MNSPPVDAPSPPVTRPPPSEGGVTGQGRPKRFLLGQLNSNGDCLYATTVARQIKADHPGCHLTWAIGSACRSVIHLNPDVDDVWEVPLTRADMAGAGYVAAWRAFRRRAEERVRAGEFDEAYFTQLLPDNAHRFDGTIRSSLFRGYPRPVTVPVAPVVRLSADEVANVRRFAEGHRLTGRAHVLLFESSPKSQQSFVTPRLALDLARAFVAAVPDARVVLSADTPAAAVDDRIVDGSVLSLRENAELTKYCTLLVGCSSGITWLATSDWAKPLPTVQFLGRGSDWPASVVRDHERWGLPTDHVIEVPDSPPEALLACLVAAATGDFAAARARYHRPVPEGLRTYDRVARSLLFGGRVRDFLRFARATAGRRRWDVPFLLWHAAAPLMAGRWAARRLAARVGRPATGCRAGPKGLT